MSGVLALITQHWREPAFALLYRDTFELRVMLALVFGDLVDRKVTCLWMSKVQSADCGTGPHRKRLC